MPRAGSFTARSLRTVRLARSPRGTIVRLVPHGRRLRPWSDPSRYPRPMTARPHALPIILLLLLVIAAFARLLFKHDGMPYAVIPWDFNSQYSPWLTNAGDSLRSGSFPPWCTYAGAGTPCFLNTQSQFWWPLTLMLGPLFGYSLYGA